MAYSMNARLNFCTLLRASTLVTDWVNQYLSRRLHAACCIFTGHCEAEGHCDVFIWMWVGVMNICIYVSTMWRKARELCLLFPPKMVGKQNNQQLLPSDTVDGMSFWRGFCTARRGEGLLLGALASHDPFWSIFGRRALAAASNHVVGHAW